MVIKLSSTRHQISTSWGVNTWKDKDTVVSLEDMVKYDLEKLDLSDSVNANFAKFSPDRPGLAWDRPGSTWDRPGSTWDRPGSTGDRPGIGQSISADLGRYILWGGTYLSLH